MSQATIIDAQPPSMTMISSPPSDSSEDDEKIVDIDQVKTGKKSTKPIFKPHQKFTMEDDTILRALVATFGESSWILIAEHMPGRNSRQCRERWLNYLSPKLNRQKFTKEEDELLLAKVNEMGTKWVTISKTYFPNRTDQMVKNRYYILKRKADKKNGVYNSSKKSKKSKQIDNCVDKNRDDIEYPVPVKNDQTFNSNDFGLDGGLFFDNDNFFDITEDSFEQNFLCSDIYGLHSF